MILSVESDLNVLKFSSPSSVYPQPDSLRNRESTVSRLCTESNWGPAPTPLDSSRHLRDPSTVEWAEIVSLYSDQIRTEVGRELRGCDEELRGRREDGRNSVDCELRWGDWTASSWGSRRGWRATLRGQASQVLRERERENAKGLKFIEIDNFIELVFSTYSLFTPN